MMAQFARDFCHAVASGNVTVECESANSAGCKQALSEAGFKFAELTDVQARLKATHVPLQRWFCPANQQIGRELPSLLFVDASTFHDKRKMEETVLNNAKRLFDELNVRVVAFNLEKGMYRLPAVFRDSCASVKFESARASRSFAVATFDCSSGKARSLKSLLGSCENALLIKLLEAQSSSVDSTTSEIVDILSRRQNDLLDDT